jgi:hypothetical protein
MEVAVEEPAALTYEARFDGEAFIDARAAAAAATGAGEEGVSRFEGLWPKVIISSNDGVCSVLELLRVCSEGSRTTRLIARDSGPR